MRFSWISARHGTLSPGRIARVSASKAPLLCYFKGTNIFFCMILLCCYLDLFIKLILNPVQNRIPRTKIPFTLKTPAFPGPHLKNIQNSLHPATPSLTKCLELYKLCVQCICIVLFFLFYR